MSQSFLKRELPTPGITSSSHRSAVTVWRRIISVVQDPVLVAIIAFCFIGLLATICMALRFSDLVEWLNN